MGPIRWRVSLGGGSQQMTGLKRLRAERVNIGGRLKNKETHYNIIAVEEIPVLCISGSVLS